MWYLIVVYLTFIGGGDLVLKGEVSPIGAFKSEYACNEQVALLKNRTEFRFNSSVEFLCLKPPSAA